MKKKSGFISYSRLNDRSGGVKRFRKKLEEAVSEVAGVDVKVFQDIDSIRTGKDWENLIFKKIEDSSFFLPIVSQAFLISDMCRRELSHAIDNKVPIFPIYWHNSRFFEDTQRLADLESKLASDIQGSIQSIKKIQYRDFRPLRNKTPSTVSYKQFIDSLAADIEESVSFV